MFNFVRKHNRILQGVLVVLILPSFVLFGVQSYSKFISDEGVIAKVDPTLTGAAVWVGKVRLIDNVLVP